MTKIELVQRIGDEVCEGCGPYTDCEEDPNDCFRITNAIDLLDGLYDVTSTHHSKIHVVKVKGWRTALVDKVGCGRETIAFCFWWFK